MKLFHNQWIVDLNVFPQGLSEEIVTVLILLIVDDRLLYTKFGAQLRQRFAHMSTYLDIHFWEGFRHCA